jgi:hypothetical protein
METKRHTSKQDRKWNEMFERFQEYVISNKVGPVGGKLGTWYMTQKYNLKAGKLREDRKIKFESIKFEFPASRKKWLIKYDQLLKFRKSYPDRRPVYNRAQLRSPESRLVIFCRQIRK